MLTNSRYFTIWSIHSFGLAYSSFVNMAKIAVFGFGSVGKKLASVISGCGYEVVIGLRKMQDEELAYVATTFKEAAEQADMVIIAIPYSVCIVVLKELRDVLKEKILVDSTNPLNDDWSPLLLGQENSAAEEISRLLPETYVIKAFNTIFADVMDKKEVKGQTITAFVAGDHAESKQKVITLASAIGYAPIDVGPLLAARYLESMAHLNIQIAVGQGGGTNAAFVYVQDK